MSNSQRGESAEDLSEQAASSREVSEQDASASRSVAPASTNPGGARIAVVVNGNARSVTDEVISTLDQILLGSDLFVSRRLEDARDIARTVVGRGYGTVLTGGGDGTFTVVVTEVIREARRQGRSLPRFGLLKLGTGNALAWVVGASPARGRGLAADVQRLLRDAGSRPLRLIEVEGFSTPFCGFGADAAMLEDYARVKSRLSKTVLRKVAAGPLSYAAAGFTKLLPGMVFGRMPHCRIINDGAEAFRLGAHGVQSGAPVAKGGLIYEGPARLTAVSTIPYYGFGFRAFPFAEERSDRMHLRVTTIGPLGLLSHFSSIWRGDYENPTLLFDFLVEAVTIEMDPPTPFQIGGDSRGDRARVSAALSAEAIRLVDFYAPPSAS